MFFGSISFVEPHFGQWVERIANRAGVSQKFFSEALGLDSYAALKQIIDKPDDRLRGATREALIRIVRAKDGDDLDRMWRAGTLPDELAVIEGIQRGVQIYRARKAMEERLKAKSERLAAPAKVSDTTRPGARDGSHPQSGSKRRASEKP